MNVLPFKRMSMKNILLKRMFIEDSVNILLKRRMFMKNVLQ